MKRMNGIQVFEAIADIDPKYILRCAPDAPFTDVIMTEMNGQYIIVTIRNPATAPTAEWLSSFGITPYVDDGDRVVS